MIKKLILALLLLPTWALSQTLPCPTGKTCSGALTFTVTFPAQGTPGSIAPTSVVQGSAATTITITAATGNTFNNQVVVEWCEATPTACTTATDLATTFVNSTTLTAVIPAGSLTASGSFSVYLSQPNGAHAILLQWDASPTQSVVGYKVYRGAVSGGPTQRWSDQRPA